VKKFHCANENLLVYSTDNQIHIQNAESEVVFPVNEVLSDSFSLLKRLLRSEIHNVLLCGDVVVVVLKGKLLFYKENRLRKELPIKRGKRPLRAGVVCYGDQLYYGDYWMNPERSEVNIHRVDLNTFEEELFYSFGHVQHIHFIQPDRWVEGSLIVGTGDRDHECGIYRIDTDTKEVETIAEGNQTYRLVSVLQHEEYMIWGTDAPNEQNYIYRLNRKSKVLERIRKIEGPAYYSAMSRGNDMYIATTVEQRDRHSAVIYKSKDFGKSWSEYRRFKKDIWHCRYFGYGIIEFIQGQEHRDELYYNAIGLKQV